MSILHRRTAILGLGHRAAIGLGSLPGFLHERFGNCKALGSQNGNVHTPARGRVKRRSRHGQRQRLRMVGPAQNELAAVGRDVEIVQCLPVREVLTRMAHGGFHVDPGFVDERGQRSELGLGHVAVEIPALGEGADAHGVAVGGDHRHGLADVLGRCAVHDDARARLEAVDRHVW